MGRQKTGMEKETISCRVETFVKKEIDRRARNSPVKTSRSDVVSFLLRQAVMTDKDYYRELMRHHAVQFELAKLAFNEAEERERFAREAEVEALRV